MMKMKEREREGVEREREGGREGGQRAGIFKIRLGLGEIKEIEGRDRDTER